MKSLMVTLFTMFLFIGVAPVNAQDEAYDEDFDMADTLEGVFAQDIDEEEDLVLDASEEELLSYENSGYKPSWSSCRRRHSHAWCSAFFAGYDHSENVFRSLMSKYHEKTPACRAHVAHYNREVKFSKPVPFRKGYIYFGRRVAYCDGR